MLRIFWREHTVCAGCLYYVLGKLKTLAGKALFRIAFAGVVFLQFILVVLFLWGISEIVPEDYGLFSGILITLVLLSPFAIGANSYFLFQRFTRVQYALAESARWHAERKRWNAQQIRRQRRIRRWLVWIPAVSVLLFCLFLDDTWPPASHLLHPTVGRLIGYRVPVPLTWAIVISEPGSDSADSQSYLWAFRSRRLFLGSVEFFLGDRPSVAVSSITFNGSPPGDELSSPWRPERQLPISTQSFPVGDTLLACEEFTLKSDQQKDQVDIRCTTPRGELTARFTGDRDDSATFYQVVQRVKKTN